MTVAKRALSVGVLILCILCSLISCSDATPVKRQTTSLSETALVIAVSVDAANEAVNILNNYIQPTQLLVVAQNGTALPPLETISGSNSVGNFGLIIVIGLASYDYGGSIGWASAITSAQFSALYAYQLKYGVRMIHLDGYPGNFAGTALALGPGGCCSAEDQAVYLLDTSVIPSGGAAVNLSTVGLWHYPATVTNFTTTTPFLGFGTNQEYSSPTVAGVIQNLGGRQQMVFFLAGASWSSTTTALGSIWFSWGYQGSTASTTSSTSSATSTASATATSTNLLLTSPLSVFTEVYTGYCIPYGNTLPGANYDYGTGNTLTGDPTFLCDQHCRCVSSYIGLIAPQTPNAPYPGVNNTQVMNCNPGPFPGFGGGQVYNIISPNYVDPPTSSTSSLSTTSTAAPTSATSTTSTTSTSTSTTTSKTSSTISTTSKTTTTSNKTSSTISTTSKTTSTSTSKTSSTTSRPTSTSTSKKSSTTSMSTSTSTSKASSTSSKTSTSSTKTTGVNPTASAVTEFTPYQTLTGFTQKFQQFWTGYGCTLNPGPLLQVDSGTYPGQNITSTLTSCSEHCYEMTPCYTFTVVDNSTMFSCQYYAYENPFVPSILSCNQPSNLAMAVYQYISRH